MIEINTSTSGETLGMWWWLILMWIQSNRMWSSVEVVQLLPDEEGVILVEKEA